MKRIFLFVVFAAGCIALTGCPDNQEASKPGGATSPPAAAPATEAPAPEAAESANEAAAPEEKKTEADSGGDINFAINYDDGFHSHGKGRFGGILAILGSHQFHVELIPNAETGSILAILYDNDFKPFKSEIKELTLSLVMDNEPKQFTFLVDFEGSKEKPALYKISDHALAKLLKDGWTGNALVSLSVDGKPVGGRLVPLKK